MAPVSLASVPLELKAEAAVHLITAGVLEPEAALAAVLFGDAEAHLLGSQETVDGYCIHGHPWTEENTRYDSKGYRRCRTCQREGMALARLREGRERHRQGYCRAGHPRNEENTYIRADGFRGCRPCNRERDRLRRERDRLRRQKEAA